MRFLGFREDVGDLLAASDMVVLPSLREGLSIALLEAMAAGKPIVATSIGSQREVAAHADMARLVRPADARALSEAIVRLAADQELMARLGSNARDLCMRAVTPNTECCRPTGSCTSTCCARSVPSRQAWPCRHTIGGRQSLKRRWVRAIPSWFPRLASRRAALYDANLPDRRTSVQERRPCDVVRTATTTIFPGIVDIHQKAFSHFFLTQLGGEFLRNYYALVLDYRAGIILVSEGPGVLEGLRLRLCRPRGVLPVDVALQTDLRAAGAFGVGASPVPRRQSPVRRSPDSNAGVGVAGRLVRTLVDRSRAGSHAATAWARP